MRSSINCSAVICSPIIIHAILREATSETSLWALASFSLPRPAGPGGGDQAGRPIRSLHHHLRLRPPDLVRLRPAGPDGVGLGFCPDTPFALCASHHSSQEERDKKGITGHFYLFAIYLFNLLQFSPVHAPISGAVTRKGLTTPLTRRIASGYYLCAGAVYVVLLGSPTGSITLVSYLREIPTAVVLYHPFLFAEIPTQLQATSKGISGTVAGEDLQHNQVPNHKCHLLAIYIICHWPLVFISPTSQPFAILFALFFVCFFLVRSLVCYLCLCCHVPFICLHLRLLKIY